MGPNKFAKYERCYDPKFPKEFVVHSLPKDLNPRIIMSWTILHSWLTPAAGVLSDLVMWFDEGLVALFGCLVELDEQALFPCYDQSNSDLSSQSLPLPRKRNLSTHCRTVIIVKYRTNFGIGTTVVIDSSKTLYDFTRSCNFYLFIYFLYFHILTRVYTKPDFLKNRL